LRRVGAERRRGGREGWEKKARARFMCVEEERVDMGAKREEEAILR